MALKNVVTPDLGGATEVTVIEVLVKPGDKVKKDTAIVTLESDKATMEVPSGDAGIVKEVKVKVGDSLTHETVLLTLETDAAAEEPAKAKPAATAATPPPEKAEKVNKPPKADQPSMVSQPEAAVLSGTVQSSNDVHAGPGVRRLGRELGVNLALLAGSGPKQRILKEDVQQYVKSQLSQLQTGSPGMPMLAAPVVDFAKFGEIETKALSRIQKISGKFLHRNWMMIPHVTQFGEADVTALEDFRQAQNNSEQGKGKKFKLTPLAFIMKAVVASLKAFPTFNASLDATGENLIIKKYFHLGVAVDTPDGLVVPVIRDVDKKGLTDLAKELAVVSEKARQKQLTPGDMQGGSFSISSLGGIGGTAFTPIINAPEVAILGVSKTSYQPVYQHNTFVPRLMLPLSLSYDHRVIDGANGARFMMHLSHGLTDIRQLLL